MLTAADRQDLHNMWQARAAQEKDAAKAAEYRRWATGALAGKRPPDPRASEQEIAWLHEHVGAKTQVSYKDRRSEHGEGSTRPDIQVTSWNIETKRYIIWRPGGQADLIRELKRQYAMRLEHLPAHLQLQAIIVDVRGQRLTPEMMTSLRNEIYQQVVVACYSEAKSGQKWWVGTNAQAPGMDTVTILAGDAG